MDKGLIIKGIIINNDRIGDLFFKLRDNEKLDNEAFLKKLLKMYEDKNKSDPTNAYNLTKEEKSEVYDAIINSNDTLQNIVKVGLLQRSRYLNSIAKTNINFDKLSDEELKKLPVKGAADYRINKIIEKIKTHNNLQSKKTNKVCLTRGIVFKLTNSNRYTINKFFDKHKSLIDDHNQKHGLTGTDNRKGKSFDWYELLSLERKIKRTSQTARRHLHYS